MSDYSDGGISGIIAVQQMALPAAQQPSNQPMGPPPWWELPTLIVLIAALSCINVWLFRRERRDRRR